MSFELSGKTYETDEEGYLQNLNDWSKEAGEYIAGTEDVEMDEKRWEVVNWLRKYYSEYGIAPAIKLLIKEMMTMFGKDKKETQKYLYLDFCKFCYCPVKSGVS